MNCFRRAAAAPRRGSARRRAARFAPSVDRDRSKIGSCSRPAPSGSTSRSPLSRASSTCCRRRATGPTPRADEPDRPELQRRPARATPRLIFDLRVNQPWNGPDPNAVPPDLSGTYHLSFNGQATIQPEYPGLQHPVHGPESGLQRVDQHHDGRPRRPAANTRDFFAISFLNTQATPTSAPQHRLQQRQADPPRLCRRQHPALHQRVPRRAQALQHPALPRPRQHQRPAVLQRQHPGDGRRPAG